MNYKELRDGLAKDALRGLVFFFVFVPACIAFLIFAIPKTGGLAAFGVVIVATIIFVQAINGNAHFFKFRSDTKDTAGQSEK